MIENNYQIALDYSYDSLMLMIIAVIVIIIFF